MLVWRLTRADRQALDGEGGRLAGGRWTPVGHPVVHAAATPALAVLERLVHTDSDLFGTNLVLLTIDVPDALSRTEVVVDTLPPAWRTTPAPGTLHNLGLAWLRARETCVLSVPSALVPQERNYLLNPRHPDFERVLVARGEAFALDPRLLQSGRPHK